MMRRNLASVCSALLLLAHPGVVSGAETSALSDEPRPLQIEAVGERVRPLLELGDTFLGIGNINEGFRLPTGAVWQPSLLVWGNLRTAVNAFDNGTPFGEGEHTSEWVNRLDLFAQVSLSQTDRIVLSVRPLDEDGDFAGQRFSPDSGSVGGGNGDLSVAFFEGNIGELFPGTGADKRRELDLDISFGRIPWLFQEGTLINDRMDSFALSRNNLTFVPGSTNTRLAVIYGWDEVNRADNREDSDAKLYGISTETDFENRTVNFDLFRVDSDDTPDGTYVGLSSTQRIGHYNTAFRIVHSNVSGRESFRASSGTLGIAEISWTPYYTHDNVYVNLFASADQFSSASRDVATGGPLGLVGILFAATGLGAYPAPLGNDAFSAYGGAIGYQKFFDNNRKQLIVELGARDGSSLPSGFFESALPLTPAQARQIDIVRNSRRQVAVGVRYQQALGRRFVARFDGYLADREDFDTGWGARFELQLKM